MKKINKIKLPRVNGKNLLYIGIFAGIVIGLIFWMRKKIKKDPSEATERAAAKEVKNKNLTYDLVQYGIFADAVEEATEDFGTDEDQIYNVFRRLQTKDDLLKLIEVFGTRWYWGNFIPVKLNLADHLYQELDNSELAQVNEILKNNGIKTEF